MCAKTPPGLNNVKMFASSIYHTIALYEKQPPNTAVMSFIKASAKGGEYERDVNATDAALDKGGNRKDLFSVYITYIIVFISFNYEFVSVRLLLIIIVLMPLIGA